MFKRQRRGLFDLLMATLCVWGAAYHTPVGALVRAAAAWAVGARSSSRPLLSYYSGGVYDGATTVPVTRPAQRAQRGPLPALTALGYNAHASLAVTPESRASVLEAARRVSLTAKGELTPADLARLVERAAAELGSQEAAVAALFCGWEAALYASERARAAGNEPTLEELSRLLPPRYATRLAAASQAMALGAAYALSWPVSETARVSSAFGFRLHPTLGTRRLHTGIDLAVPSGSEVRATAAGVVRRASEDGVNGRVLIVDHGRGVTTAYCHNSELLVAAGARVAAGEVISRSGNTGRSSGPHLHYQLELGSRPVDPLAYRASPLAMAGGHD